MSLTDIKPTNALSDFTVDSVSYKKILTGFRLSESAPEENDTTFDNEASGGAFSIGTPVTRGHLTFDLKYGDEGTRPFTPIINYQGKAFEATFATGCTISGTANFLGNDLDNVAGVLRTGSSADFRTTGAVSVTWDEGST